MSRVVKGFRASGCFGFRARDDYSLGCRASTLAMGLRFCSQGWWKLGKLKMLRSTPTQV